MALELITNRTAGAKYNLADDCNRVENAVLTLQTALNSVGFNLNLTVKTDWEITDTPTQSDMERYRLNVSAIRAALNVLETTPAAPDSMRYLTYAQANNIEQILLDVESLIESMQAVFVHSAQKIVNCGSLVAYLTMQTMYTLLDSSGVILCDSTGAVLKAGDL